ncbi:MAG: thioredoxin domain-containing protein, partial [Candidatus Hodarchaeota archaeon]
KMEFISMDSLEGRTVDEKIEEILEKDELDLIINLFNIEESGNYLEEASGKKTGRSILHLTNLPDKEIVDKINELRDTLFKTRENRSHPHKDEKILTDWNGLMIAALAKGGIAFKEDKYIEIAKKAANFILSNLTDSNSKLLHRYKDGVSEINGFLTDYSFFIWGLTELYEATFNINYLKSALELHKTQIEDFWDKNIGGFFFTSRYSEQLLTKQKDIYDGAIPSGNSIAMLNLLRLSYITGEHELEEKADKLLRVFSEKIKANPLAYTQFLVAIDFAVGPSYSLVIAGNSYAEDTKKFINLISNEYIPNKVLMLRKIDQEVPDIDQYSNFVEYFYDYEKKATAYVCINKTCKPPTHDINQTLEFLKPKWV